MTMAPLILANDINDPTRATLHLHCHSSASYLFSMKKVNTPSSLNPFSSQTLILYCFITPDTPLTSNVFYMNDTSNTNREKRQQDSLSDFAFSEQANRYITNVLNK